MTAKKTVPVNEDNQKIWGFFDSEGQVFREDLTRAQAEKGALEYKGNYPDESVTIFKKVATVENNPYIKGV